MKHHHYLKVSPKEFISIENGTQTFKVEKKENFKLYDIIHLLEWTESDGYSGRNINCIISCISDDQEYLKDDYIILGFTKLYA